MQNRKSRPHKIEVPLNKHITLRLHSEYPLDEEDVAKLNNSYNTALNYVSYAMSEVKSLIDELSNAWLGDLVTKHQNLFDQLQRHFHIEADLPPSVIFGYLKRIDNALQKIWDGMYAEHSPLCLTSISEGMMDAYKRKGLYPLGYVYKSPPKSNNNRIYLNLDDLLVLVSNNQLVEVLIHECTHKFANTDDYNIDYDTRINNRALDALLDLYDKCSGTNAALAKMSQEKRLTHAASMTSFVCEMAIFSQDFQETKDINATYPERELTLKDTNRFFAAKKPRNATNGHVVAGAAVVAATAAVLVGYSLL